MIIQTLIAIIASFPPLVYLVTKLVVLPFSPRNAKTVGSVAGAFDGLIMGIIMLPLFSTSQFLPLYQAVPIIIAFGATACLLVYIFLSSSSNKRGFVSLYTRFIAILGYGFYLIVFTLGLINNLIFFMS